MSFKLKDKDQIVTSYDEPKVKIPSATVDGEFEVFVKDGVVPSGKKIITNTQEADVSSFATAQVVDANLKAENIKKGEPILGIIGTYEGIIPSGIKYITGTSAVDVRDYAQAKISDENVALIDDGNNIKAGVTILGRLGTYTGDTPENCIRVGRSISYLYVNHNYDVYDMLTYLRGLTYDENRTCVLFRSPLSAYGHFDVVAEISIADLYEIYAIVYYTDVQQTKERIFGLDYSISEYKFMTPYNFKLTYDGAESYTVSYLKNDFIEIIDGIFSRDSLAFGPWAHPNGNYTIGDTLVHDVMDYATAQVNTMNINASNIRKGVEILNIVGTYEGVIPEYSIKHTEYSNLYFNTDYSLDEFLSTLEYPTNNQIPLFVFGIDNDKLYWLISQKTDDGYIMFLSKWIVPTEEQVVIEENIPVYATYAGGQIVIEDTFIIPEFTKGWNISEYNFESAVSDFIPFDIFDPVRDSVVAIENITFGHKESGKTLSDIEISVNSEGEITARAVYTDGTYSDNFVHQLSNEDDPDFMAQNIKNNVNIFGVTGTYSGSTGEEVIYENNSLIFNGDTSVDNNDLVLASEAHVENKKLIFD